MLNTIDVLSYTQTQKEAIYRQLDQTTQRLNVGLVAITDVRNARAQYGTVLASEVTVRNNLDNAVEQLRQVTDNYYPRLATLNAGNFKTDKPQPVSVLLREAEKRSLSLLQTRPGQDLARKQVRQVQDGHLPMLDLMVSTGISDTSYSGSKTHGAVSIQYDGNNMGQNKVSLGFSLPIYQGGMINLQVKQAQHNFVGASEQLESVHYSIVQTVRSSFNNINASISSINAYKRAVVSAQNSLDTTEMDYSVGTRTVIDVLDTITMLYNAKQELANAHYNYLISQLSIKPALGTLNEQDLLALGSTLNEPVSTDLENVAPQTPEQSAITDDYTPDGPALVAQQTSAHTITNNGHNPFRNW